MANKIVEFPLSILVVFISYWIVTLQELYFLLRRTSHHFLLINTTTTSCCSSWEGYWKFYTPAKIQTNNNSNNNAAGGRRASSLTSKEEERKITISSEDLGTIMGKVGIAWEQSGMEKEKRLGLAEISSLFNEDDDDDEDQPRTTTRISIEEAREAFELFDENKDGFIDAKELKKMICALGFKETTETECQKMISAFDCNGDRLIDFHEFLKVLDDSFC